MPVSHTAPGANLKFGATPYRGTHRSFKNLQKRDSCLTEGFLQFLGSAPDTRLQRAERNVTCLYEPQVTPSPNHPSLQVQVKLPSVFIHSALASQLSVSCIHSSISETARDRDRVQCAPGLSQPAEDASKRDTEHKANCRRHAFQNPVSLEITDIIVRSPFGAMHHVVVQYMARWMKCPLPLPKPPLPPAGPPPPCWTIPMEKTLPAKDFALQLP